MELPEPLLDETEKIGSEIPCRFGAREGLQRFLGLLDGLKGDPQTQPPDARRRCEAQRRLILLDRFLVTIEPLEKRGRKRVKVRVAVRRCGMSLQHEKRRGDIVALDHDAREQHGETGVLRVEREGLLEGSSSLVHAFGLEQ